MPSSVPHHPLSKVRGLIRAGKVMVTRRAQRAARWDFGWGVPEIKEALLALTESECYNAQEHMNIRHAVVDMYRANNLYDGEDVYTHFYILDGKLVVDSFKQLNN